MELFSQVISKITNQSDRVPGYSKMGTILRESTLKESKKEAKTKKSQYLRKTVNLQPKN